MNNITTTVGSKQPQLLLSFYLDTKYSVDILCKGLIEYFESVGLGVWLGVGKGKGASVSVICREREKEKNYGKSVHEAQGSIRSTVQRGGSAQRAPRRRSSLSS